MEDKDEGFLKCHIHTELSLVLCDDLEGWNGGCMGGLGGRRYMYSYG